MTAIADPLDPADRARLAARMRDLAELQQGGRGTQPATGEG